MKGLQIATAIGGIAIVGLGASLAITNPSQETYEDYAKEYARQKLTKYLQEDLCLKIPAAAPIFGNSLQTECKSLADTHQAEIKELISKGTKRQNFILFSVYKTDLSVSTLMPFLPANLLPAYHFETVGAFNNFYSYQSQKQ